MNKSSAVVVIDLQCGAFDGKEIPVMHRGAEILERASTLIAAARAAEIPVVFVQHCAAEGQLLVEGTAPWEIHPSVSPDASEAVVRKRASSAFEGTELQQLLEQRGVDTIIACGLQSEFCVANTCIAAMELGLNVYVAEDAHTTLSTDEDDASVIIERQNRRLAERGAVIQSTAAIVDLLAAV